MIKITMVHFLVFIECTGRVLGRVCEPLYIIGWSKSFFWNRSAQTVHFAPFLFTKLLQFSSILGLSGVNHSREVKPKHLNQVHIWTLFWAASESGFSSAKVVFVDFLLFFGSLSCCITQIKCRHLCRKLNWTVRNFLCLFIVLWADDRQL